MSCLSKVLPYSAQRMLAARSFSASESEVRTDYSIAKFKEVYELMQESHRYFDFESKVQFYPSHLSHKIKELLQIFGSTDHFAALSEVDKNRFYKLDELQGFALTKAIRTEKIAGKTFKQFFRDLEGSENSQIIPIEKGSPFYQSDLVIFKNDSPLQLPPNGMYEADFKKMEAFYSKAAENRLSGFEVTGGTLFQIRFRRAFRKLLTRAQGRELAYKVLGQNWGQYFKEKLSLSGHKVTIRNSFSKSCARSIQSAWQHPLGFPLYNTSGYTVDLYWNDPKSHIDIGDDSLAFVVPDVALLAHEFLHVAHFRAGKKWRAENKAELKRYTDEEEKVSITGKLNGSDQDPISENSIRRAFGFFDRKFHEVRV